MDSEASSGVTWSLTFRLPFFWSGNVNSLTLRNCCCHLQVYVLLTTSLLERAGVTSVEQPQQSIESECVSA